MKTRNQGKYEHGTYLYKKQLYTISSKRKTLKKAPKKVEETVTELSEIGNMINYLIVSQLKSRRKVSPYFRGELFIENRLIKILKRNYNLTNKYTTNLNLLNDLNIINENFSNENDFSSFEKDKFRIKITDSKKVTHMSRNQIETVLQAKKKLTFDFLIQQAVAI